MKEIISLEKVLDLLPNILFLGQFLLKSFEILPYKLFSKLRPYQVNQGHNNQHNREEPPYFNLVHETRIIVDYTKKLESKHPNRYQNNVIPPMLTGNKPKYQ